jgi:2,3-bisphosphoglycerate-independent phosphoglycerate mutase
LKQKKRRLLLVILDGWGINPEVKGNAIALGKTPKFDGLVKQFPYTELVASGEAIDLPPGHMGNSEVGHQNIGAGRVVPQASTSITRAINDGSFFDPGNLLPKTMVETKARNTTVHLFGLLSDGLVHSHINHAISLIKLAHKIDVDCSIHALLDGRDVPPMSAKKYISVLQEVMDQLGTGRFGTLTGRVLYERDHKKWHHVKGLYDLLVHNKGTFVKSPLSAVDHAYQHGITIDEHIPPYVIVDDQNQPVAKLKNGDLFINWNFRGDRATMLSHAMVDKEFTHFSRGSHPNFKYICMSLYDDSISAPVAFPPAKLKIVLSEVLSKYGFRQFKTAETTKFYHLTFFFNCRRLKPFPNEVQQMISSKKNDKYDEVPEMSAAEVGDSIISALNSNEFDFLAVNFANPDMVGHTGNLEAAIKAIEIVDTNLGRVVRTARNNKYSIIITADHGNAERMLDLKTNKPHTAHTPSNVPFILVLDDELKNDFQKILLRSDGILGDIGPTILQLLDVPKPEEMTCKSLIF